MMTSPAATPTILPRQAAARLVAEHGANPEWLDAFAEALERQRGAASLHRILNVWGISQSEAARRFGVSRQAVGRWLGSGIPEDRLPAITDLAATTDLLVHYLKRDRIPGIVRRPAPGLGNISFLDLLGQGRTAELLEACRSMFDFADSHR